QIVGKRQQHGHGGRGAEAGQYANERSQQRAGEAEGEVLRRERGAQTEGEALQEVHRQTPVIQRASSGYGSPSATTKTSAQKSVRTAVVMIAATRLIRPEDSEARKVEPATAGAKPSARTDAAK